MSVFRHFVAAVALAAFALGANPETAAAPASGGKSPNIILITLDTTRADRMGFLGSKRGATPNLDGLAKESIIFTRAYSQAPLTPPSHATILTGTYPQYHHINDMQATLGRDLPYTPEILRGHGYHTGAFLGAIVLKAEKPYVPGFDRGFDTYDADFHDEGVGEDRYSTVVRRGMEVVARAMAWVDQHRDGPFFIWIHMYDAHDPYDPPEPYKTRFAAEPYDGGVAYEDAAVGKLLQELKARSLYDGAVMAIMADHGESLGAHGEDTHGIFLYDETIHVPLLIKLPHAASGGERVENRVELVDVAPTLLQQAGVAIPKEMQGESLLGLTKEGAAEVWHDRPAYSQAEYSLDFGWSALRSLRAEKYLYVQAPRRELYDEKNDPGAEHNLASSSAAVADTLAGQMQALRDKTVNTSAGPKTVLTPGAQEKLEALGYMASASDKSKTDAARGPDPKDKIEIANMIHRADLLQEQMHHEESIALLEQIIAKNPTANFYLKLGTWHMRKHDCGKAMPALRESLQLDPDLDGARFMLGKCLIATQDYAGTITEMEKLVARVPNAVEAHSFLELAYLRTNRLQDAIRECRIVLKYDPEDYGSFLVLGQSLAVTGDPAQGIALLKKAAAMQPEDPTPHAWLADIYDHAGQKAEADKERAEVEKLANAPPPQQ